MTDDAQPVAAEPVAAELSGAHPTEVDRPWSWYLTRVSGLFLAVLVPWHFAVVVLRDDIGTTTIITVTDRFADPRWQAVEWITVVLALTHGFLALRAVLVRSAISQRRQDVLVIMLGVVAMLLAMSVTWTFFTFA